MILHRRQLLTAVPAGLMLTGCDALTRNPTAKAVIGAGEQATYRWQRLVGRDGLAREFSAADISPTFKVNGTHEPTNPEWQQLAAGQFADWRLKVTGLVRNEPRSPATTAWKAGAPSANGPGRNLPKS